ncbi:MAG: NADH-quinone oxidoreductase subunit J [Planctomycetes bacterium]|nr:NADH-quinone oxidoreductase subunit J [Planctomycetota bacterium]
MELSDRIFYPLVAVLGLGAIGAGALSAGGPGAAFGLFAWLVLGGSLVCIWERSVVRSAFALLGTFGGTAGLFLLLGSDFLAMSQILIYVGGILALILFGVMLTPPDLTERKLPRVAAGLVAVGAGVAFIAAKVAMTADWVQAAELAEPKSATREIGVAFVAAEEYVVPFELAAVVLTVALVAAVYVARRRTSDLKPEAGAEAEPRA